MNYDLDMPSEVLDQLPNTGVAYVEYLRARAVVRDAKGEGVVSLGGYDDDNVAMVDKVKVAETVLANVLDGMFHGETDCDNSGLEGVMLALIGEHVLRYGQLWQVLQDVITRPTSSEETVYAAASRFQDQARRVALQFDEHLRLHLGLPAPGNLSDTQRRYPTTIDR